MHQATITELMKIFSIPEHADFIGFAVMRKSSEKFLVSHPKDYLRSIWSLNFDHAFIFDTQSEAINFVNQYAKDSLVILLFDYGESIQSFYFS